MIKKLFIIFILLFAFVSGFWLAFIKTLKMGVIKVPNVIGKALEEAEIILKAQNLEYILDVNLSGYSEKIKQGYVLRQEPKEGSIIKSKSKVKIGLSLGPARVAVPDLINKHYYEAELFLKSQNFKLGKISYMDWYGEESVILSQYPPPNSLVSPSTTIDLLVSRSGRAQSYLMPDFLMKNYEFVLSELTGMGFKVEKPREIKIPHYDSGIILSQSPLPFTKITKKTPIIFTINSKL